MKTARFTDLVRAGGKPESYTLWSDPKTDGAFQSALKQHRVLSVHQETVGAKADYGAVGYEGDKQGAILIFPKSIQRFAGRKIVGVKYELLEQPKEAASPETKKVPRAKKAAPRAPAPPPHEPEDEAEHEPEEESVTRPARRSKPSEPPPDAARDERASKEEPDRAGLVKGIRAAMKLLDDGKAVAAYRALEKLV